MWGSAVHPRPGRSYGGSDGCVQLSDYYRPLVPGTVCFRSCLRSSPFLSIDEGSDLLGSESGQSLRLVVPAGLSVRVPAGYREAQSGTVLSFPERSFILNLYIRLRSLKFSSRVFLIFSRAWSEIISVSGWWSTVTSRSGHPRINILHDSNPEISASASPSTGA